MEIVKGSPESAPLLSGGFSKKDWQSQIFFGGQKLIENAEIVLVLLFALLCAAAWASKPSVPRAIAVDIASTDQMAVVIVTGKRLTADEKRALM